MWPLMVPMLLPWLTRIFWIGSIAAIVGLKLWLLILPLGLLFLLMKVRVRRDKP